MHILRGELPTVDVTVSSDYSPDLAEGLERGRLDLAFLRADPDFDLTYQVVGQEPLVVLMPSDHPLTTFDAIHPQQLVGQPFVAMVNKAKVLRGVIDDYLKRSGVQITPTQGADNPAMVMSLVASMRGMALIPAYVENLMPWSVVSRPLAGDVPTIDLAVGYKKTNNSPVLKLFLARLDELIARVSTQAQLIARKSQERN
jgi:LysR family hca operon transcriptional activator